MALVRDRDGEVPSGDGVRLAPTCTKHFPHHPMHQHQHQHQRLRARGRVFVEGEARAFRGCWRTRGLGWLGPWRWLG